MSFKELGVGLELLEAINSIGWIKPTPIQEKTLAKGIAGEDISGMAETGSGKTGAYLIPLIQRLINKGKPEKFGIILAPTRELVLQICEVAEKLAEKLNIRIIPIYGGVEQVEQMNNLAKRPHIIIATPGRIAQLIRDTVGFDLKPVEVIVIDEADRMAAVEFFDDISVITSKTAKNHQIMLFSATMPKNLDKFTALYSKKASVVQIGSRESVPDSLKEEICVIKKGLKDATLFHIISDEPESQFVVFVESCRDCKILSMTLEGLGVKVGSADGSMAQADREEQFQRFRLGDIRVLVSTNVLGRGVDIPCIDCVINYDVPSSDKEYIHRSGRAGRANRAGTAITFVTKEGLDRFKRLEQFLGRRLPPRKIETSAVTSLAKKVDEAHEAAVEKYKRQSRGIFD